MMQHLVIWKEEDNRKNAIFLSNYKKRGLLACQSRRIQQVVKSVMAAETLTLLNAAKAGICLKAILKEILQLSGDWPIVKCSVDSKSLVESVYSTRLVQDRRLRINISVLKDMIKQKEIHAISWVQSAHQLANVLTKRSVCPNSLMGALELVNIWKD